MQVNEKSTLMLDVIFSLILRTLAASVVILLAYFHSRSSVHLRRYLYGFKTRSRKLASFNKSTRRRSSKVTAIKTGNIARDVTRPICTRFVRLATSH